MRFLLSKAKIREFRRAYNLIWKSKSEFSVPFFTRLKFASKGFNANEIIWYDLKNNDYNDYICEYKRLMSREINGPYKFILDDKLVFEEIFGQYTSVPKNYAYIKNGTVYPLHNYNINRENLIEFLKNSRKTIFKYLNRGGGGTFVFEACSEGLLANGKLITEEEIFSIFDRKGISILCEFVEQGEFPASLYPDTTNTIRIICAKGPRQERAVVVDAVQRIGRKECIPVDNFSSGGLVSEIDLETGILSEAVSGHGKEKMIWYTHHPDTGDAIEGKAIPGWKNLLNQIETLTNKFPYLNFVAWDVLLTNDDSLSYCIIEGNASSGADLLQMKEGKANSALGKIYNDYGIKLN